MKHAFKTRSKIPSIETCTATVKADRPTLVKELTAGGATRFSPSLINAPREKKPAQVFLS
jgi:hypothetical protein